jgi:hypothetical protein
MTGGRLNGVEGNDERLSVKLESARTNFKCNELEAMTTTKNTSQKLIEQWTECKLISARDVARKHKSDPD